jgi:hypothetical protein
MDPAFRSRAPRLVIDKDGKERLLVEDQILGSQQGMGGIGGVGARQGVVSAEMMSYEEGRPGGFDPHKRLPDMDLDGIDAAFLYPSMGLFARAVHDPQLASALCRAITAGSPITASPIPTDCSASQCCRCSRSNHAIAEMRFARRDLRFRGGFLQPNPYNDRNCTTRPMTRCGAPPRISTLDRHSRGRQQRHADGRHRPLRRPRRAAHHLAQMMLAA